MRFDSYHPAINLIYFAMVFGFTIAISHPVFVMIAFLSSFIYSVKLNGKKQVVLNVSLIPLILLYTAWYSYYNHFGITNLYNNFIDNKITLEAVTYGFIISVKVAAIVMLCSCLFSIFTTDKVVYLFGKVSPKLSLYLSIVLRFVPRIKNQSKRINTGRKGIGRGALQGNLIERVINLFKRISITITWALESLIESATSMKSRGYILKGRTAFSIYRFDNRDRGFVLSIFAIFIVVMMAVMLGQTYVMFDPSIVISRFTTISIAFYLAYALLFLLPMILQVIGEIKFKRLQSRI